MITVPCLQVTLLIVLQQTSAFLEIFPQSLILKGKVIDVGLVCIQGFDGLLVSLQDQDLLREWVVLPIQEVNLVGQFTDCLLICLVSVADTQHLQVLATFIQFLKTLYFFFSHYDMLLCLLQLILNL